MEGSRRRLQTVGSHLRSSRLQPDLTSATQSAAVSPFTFDNAVLSAEEKEQYDRLGFVVKRGLVDRQETAKYRERFRQLCSGEAVSPGVTIMRDVAIVKSEFVPGERAVTKIQNFQDDEVLFDFCAHPAVVKVVQAFTGEDVMAMHTMLINKPPDPGSQTSRHPLHQDLHYFPFRPADRIVCAWTALEHVHRRNGCLVVVPGTHKTHSLLPHIYPKWKGGVNKMYYGIPDEVVDQYRDDMVHLEMSEGDTVFFHPLLIHGSGRNRTNGFRKAISCHYASAHCWYVETNESQGELVKETKEAAFHLLKRRGLADVDKLDVNFSDLWKIRARLVAGSEGALSA